jgi:hypothetical protein
MYVFLNKTYLKKLKLLNKYDAYMHVTKILLSLYFF